MKALQLIQMSNSDANVFFQVSNGKDKEWVEKFARYDFVICAGLHYIRY